jgi:hypothetical protein
MEDAFAPGARLGSYEIVALLGAGGMGEVYRARDTRLGRAVAIKALRAGADPELLHRLEREARATSGLNHPNIVHIYDVGEVQGRGPYVVMELVEGETLRQRLRRGPLPIAVALDLAAQLGDGLAKAHRAGIVHRDLKPENVMITPDGVLKVLDFGLAKVLATPLAGIEDGQTLSRHGTRAGLLLGTLEYMSPEQASGRAVDQRTDQFALGLIVHEMLSGRPAFRRDTPAQVLAAVIEREAEPLARVRSDAPPELEALVARCLQKDPERRFPSTDALAAELSRLAGRSRAGSLAGVAVVPPLPARVPAQIVPPPPPGPSGPYRVQVGNDVKTYEEPKLVTLIRKGKLTGAELARRDDEDDWRPLYDTRVFRREVPTLADPRIAAGQRVLNAVGAHFMGFVITGIVMFATQGHLPWWMAIWGVVLVMQTLGTLPSALGLLRARRAAELPPPAPALPPAPPVTGIPSAVHREAGHVRALIEQRGGSEAARLIAEVDGILKLTGQLTAREADLEEQTSDRERSALAASVAAARTRLERAELEQDRRLFERQLEVLQGREDAIAKAVRVLERLRVRREVAEHQLKQLRLDLSRGAASGLDLPELSSRLQFIRDEVDAREEVAEIGARR